MRLPIFFALMFLPLASPAQTPSSPPPPPAPLTWAEIDRAFGEGKFATVLRNVDRFVESDEDSLNFMPRYYRGAARVEALWQARTGVPLGTSRPIEARRDSFEIVFPAPFVAQLEGAMADLAIAGRALTFEQATGARADDDTLGKRISIYRAVATAELAVHARQTRPAFATVLTSLTLLEPDSPSLVVWARTAELRARVVTGDFAGAVAAYLRWAGSTRVDGELALPALIGACDLAGNYARGRGYLLDAAHVALRADPQAAEKGRLDPARRALRAHLQNLRLAADQKRESLAKPLQLARHASAFFLHDAPTEADRRFILEAARRLREEFKETVPADLEIFAIITAVQIGSEAEAAAARERLAALLADDPDNAGLRAARGIAAERQGDLKQAEADLKFAVGRDAFWAHGLRAFEALARVYEKTGRAEPARETAEQAAKLGQLLSALAQ